MNKIVSNFLCGSAVGCTVGLAFYFARHKFRSARGRRAYRNDTMFVNSGNAACTLCGGTATRMHYSDRLGEWYCWDRKLCVLTSTFQAMLKEIESA